MRITIMMFFRLLIIGMLFSTATNAASVSGYIYEDYNFGGTVRTYDSSKGMSRLKLTSHGLALTINGYSIYTSTLVNGSYYFSGISPGIYTLSVYSTKSPYGSDIDDKDGSLYSERGDCDNCRPIQVYPTVSTEFTQRVIVSGSGSVVTADIGINYSTIINDNDNGDGSLRQFLVNSKYLTTGRGINGLTKSGLEQDNHQSSADNAIFIPTMANNTIILNSPLEMDGFSDTNIDAKQLGITLRNHRSPFDGDHGIKISNSHAIKFNNFIMSYFDSAIYLNNTSNSLISSNSISNSKFTDIFIDHSDENKIIDNNLSFSHTYSILLDDSDNNIIENNVINNAFSKSNELNTSSAIFFQGDDGNDGSSYNKVNNNIISNTASGNINISTTTPPSAIRVMNGTNNKLSQNTFLNNVGLSIDLYWGAGPGFMNPNDSLYNPSNGVSNHEIDSPSITEYELSGNDLYVKGFIGKDSGTSVFANNTVEVYTASTDIIGQTVGEEYLGSCISDSNGNFECTLNVSGKGLTAQLKITALAIDSVLNTSEFGALGIALLPSDFGDAPEGILPVSDQGWGLTSYPTLNSSDGARHTISDACLGTLDPALCPISMSSDTDGYANNNTALSDSEDDGVAFNLNDPVIGSSGKAILQTDTIAIAVPNELTITASKAGFISFWLDLKQDGDWDDTSVAGIDEFIIQAEPVNAGTNIITFNLPPSTPHGSTYLRVRYATDSTEIMTPTGIASDGEIEDYLVHIAAPSTDRIGCYGGLQNGSFETTPVFDSETVVIGWSARPTENNKQGAESKNKIEIANSQHIYGTPPPNDGTVYALELMGDDATIVYQDIVTKPGSYIPWSFDYVKRENAKECGGWLTPQVCDQEINFYISPPESKSLVGGYIAYSHWKTKDHHDYGGIGYKVPTRQYITRIMFEPEVPVNGTVGNIIDNVQFGCSTNPTGFDYGDIPSQYNDNDEFDHHIVSSQLYIGSNIPDVESEPQSNDMASGDDTNGINDENSYPNNIYIDTTKAWSTDVTVVNNTGSDAYLVGWIDINTNDKMNDLESTYKLIPSNGKQTVTLTWSAAQLANAGSQMSPSYMRLRLGTQLDSDNVIDDSVIQLGEVEDHRVYLMPQPIIPENTCSSFVQTKATGGNFSYSKWSVKNGVVEFSDLNENLAVPWINAIGLNVVDGLIYGVSAENLKGEGIVQLAVADQSPGAEFTPLGEIKAADNLTLTNLKHKTSIRYVKGQTLTFGNGVSSVFKANQGAVTLDGKHLILIHRQWGEIIKVNLKTLEFSVVPIGIAANFAISTLPWDPDIAFTFYGDRNLAYTVRLKSKKYYSLDINTGEVEEYPFTFEIPTALAPGGSLGYSGGYAMDTSGVIYAMTNGGNHDTNGDGYHDLIGKTALYRVDVTSGKASYQLEGQDQLIKTNDAAGCLRQADYGDAMIDDGGAEPPHHYKSNLYLGATWNSNFAPLWDAEANADLDDDGLISIDGFVIAPTDHHIPLQDGKTHRFVINASQASTLSLWFDWDGSKTLDSSEKSVFSLNSGNNSIDITVPKGTKGDVLMRMRVSRSAVNPHGLVIDGEVEDYLFEVKSAVSDISVVADNYNPLTCEVVTIDVTTLDDHGVPIKFDDDIEISINKLSGNGSLSGSCWLSASNSDPSSGSNKCSSPITVKYNDESVRQVYLESYYEGMVLSVHAEAVKDNKVSDDSSGIVFRKEGYVLGVDLGDNHPVTHSPYYLSGEPFKVTLTRQTVVDSGGSPVCQVNKDYEGIKNVNFKVDYAQGTQDPMGLRIGDVSAPENVFDSGYTQIATDFVSGKATIDAAYFDAGMIQISTEYVPDGGVSGGWDHSKSMSVAPYALELETIAASLKKVALIVNPVGVTEFIPAQTPFDVTVKAVAKDGTVTHNFNYAAPTVIGSIVTPASKTLGQLDIPSSTLDFSDGKSIAVGYKYHEVGSLELNYTADKYLGLTTTHLTLDTSPIGHFYPAQFEVLSNVFSSDTEHSLGSDEYWTYYGKPDISLHLILEAQGVDGGALSYYDDQLFTSSSSFEPTSIELSMTNSGLDLCDQEVLMTQSLPIDFTTNNCNFMSQWTNGQYAVSESNMWVIRSVNAQDEPLAPQSGVDVILLANNDKVPYILNGQATVKTSHQFDETLDLRFGRLTLADTHGAIDVSIPMPMNIEFWDGDSFEINAWDNTSDISSIGAFVTPVVDPTDLNVILSSPVLRDALFDLSVTGDGPGNALIEFDLQDTSVDAIDNDSSEWLGYCWRLDPNDSNADECTDEDMYQQNPSAVAIFGEQRKSDNLIFWRELFN